MKKKIIIILVIHCSLLTKIFSQCFAEYRGLNFIINEVKQFSVPIKISDLEKEIDQKSKIFLKYFNTKNYDEYKKLFLAGEFPGISQNQYENWMISNKNIDLSLTGYLDIIHNGSSYLIFQYDFETSITEFTEVIIFVKFSESYFYLPADKFPFLSLYEIGFKDGNSLIKVMEFEKVNTNIFDRMQLRRPKDILDKSKYIGKLELICTTYNLTLQERKQVIDLFNKSEFESMADIIYNKLNNENKNYTDLYETINSQLGINIFSVSSNLKD